MAVKPDARPPRVDRQAALFAYASGAVGLLWVASLALFYAAEITTDGPYIWGPIGDVTTVLYNLLILPVLWRFSAPVSRVLWWIVLVFSITAAVCGTLFIFSIMTFGMSTAFTIVALIVQAVWFVLVNRLWLRKDGYPRQFGRFGQLAGAAVLIGFAIFEWGLVLPEFRDVFSAAGLIIGGLGWASMPVWLLLAAGQLRRGLSR